jgi:hypothetical protein
MLPNLLLLEVMVHLRNGDVKCGICEKWTQTNGRLVNCRLSKVTPRPPIRARLEVSDAAFKYSPYETSYRI